MNKIKNIVRNIALLLMLFFSISIVAQVSKTNGTRITDNMVEKSLDDTAILDLDSSSKGFYMPRMNTAQRDQLASRLLKGKEKGNENTGLVIYNTSNDCIEYWHASTEKWRSLCGSLPPAKLDLMDGCENVELSANIKVDGVAAPSWQQGMALKPEEHTMTIRVYVSQIGTYQISADSGNGYFFSAEGQFQSEGNYTVVLKGMGAPKQGYDQGATNTGQKADRLKFSFNGQPSAKCPNGVAVNIIPAFLKFQINREEYQAKGNYFVGKEASELEGNKIEIKVNVDVIGTARVVAKNDALGLAFVGEKIFTIDGPNQSMTLTPMSGKLAPKLNELESYELKFEPVVKPEDVLNTINGATAIVKVHRSEISLDPKDVQFGKEPFYQGTAINAKNVITVPVKVIGSGKVDLVLTNAEGVKFEAKGVVLNKLENENEKQNITFTPVIDDTKKMPETATSEFTLSGTGGRFFVADDSKKITFELEKKPVNYSFDCNSITKTKNTITVGKSIGKTFALEVMVNVLQTGEYELRTDTDIEGIYFSSSKGGVKQSFDHTGLQKVTLYAEDEGIAPGTKAVHNVRIVNRDGNKGTICSSSIPIKVGNVDLNVLYLHANMVGDGYGNGYHFDKWFNYDKRFGDVPNDDLLVETGTPKLTKIVMDGVSNNWDGRPYEKRHYYHPDAIALRKNIAKDIMDKKYNLIYIDGYYTAVNSLDPGIQLALDNYVIEQKGTLVLFGGVRGSNNNFFENWANLDGDLQRYPEEKKDKNATIYWLRDKISSGELPVKRISAVKTQPFGVYVDVPRLSFIKHYPLKDEYNISTTNEFAQIDVTGSKWEVLVKSYANSGTNLGPIIMHKDYKVIIAALSEGTQGRYFWFENRLGPAPKYDIGAVNPYYDINSQNYSQITYYMGNLMLTLIQNIMNE